MVTVPFFGTVKSGLHALKKSRKIESSTKKKDFGLKKIVYVMRMFWKAGCLKNLTRLTKKVKKCSLERAPEKKKSGKIEYSTKKIYFAFKECPYVMGTF